MSGGPLAGLKVLEVESIGPGPFAAMALADMGANVLRIARPEKAGRKPNAVLGRGRSGTLTLDLKSPGSAERLLQLVEHADALIEGFRPGVMERLGLGPQVCLLRNERLVYGRVTGWGRSGPLAKSAGHDINYIALTGALHACGTAESGPVPPLNLVGDFGGGGMMLAFGVVCALFEARGSGQGQVVDAAMIDGASALMGMMYGLRASGHWRAPRAGNILDGSAYFYTCYRCADDGWMAVGAIEPEFRRELLRGLQLEGDSEAIMAAAANDPEVRRRIAAIFATRTRAEWEGIFGGTDACASPVLTMDEAAGHAQNSARGTFTVIDGVTHPRPTPQFSRTPPSAPGRPETPETRTAGLEAWGLAGSDVV